MFLSISDLPYDIPPLIFAQLRYDLNSLSNCALVNKWFYEPAMYALYRDLQIETFINANGVQLFKNCKVGKKALSTLERTDKAWLRSAVQTIEHRFSVTLRAATLPECSSWGIPNLPRLEVYTLRSTDHSDIPHTFLKSLMNSLLDSPTNLVHFGLHAGPLSDFHIDLLGLLPLSIKGFVAGGFISLQSIIRFVDLMHQRGLRHLGILDTYALSLQSVANFQPLLTQLTKLRLGSGHHLSESQLLTEILAHTPNLTVLDIFYDGFLSSGWDSSNESDVDVDLVWLPLLESFTIRHHGVAADNQVEVLGRWIKSVLRSVGGLREFRMYSDDRKDCRRAWTGHLISALSGKTETVSKPQHLPEEKNEGETSVVVVKNRGRRLQVLDLPYVRLGEKGIRSLLDYAPGLQSLDFAMAEPVFSICPSNWNPKGSASATAAKNHLKRIGLHTALSLPESKLQALAMCKNGETAVAGAGENAQGCERCRDRRFIIGWHEEKNGQNEFLLWESRT